MLWQVEEITDIQPWPHSSHLSCSLTLVSLLLDLLALRHSCVDILYSSLTVMSDILETINHVNGAMGGEYLLIFVHRVRI